MMDIATQAQAILDFWFTELTPEQHWAKDEALDALIELRFREWRDAVLASNAKGWDGDGHSLLAAIILLDQFSRNIYRDTPKAFEADPLALELTLVAIGKGYHHHMPAAQRGFLYMPLMHAEDKGVHRFALRCFAEAGLEKQVDFAREHAEVIFRFGRYPTRNAILGRSSSEEEKAYLAQPGVGW